MGKLLDIIITWFLENFLASIFKKLDRWDVLVLASLAVGSVALWAWVARFNFGEKVLWVSFLIVLALSWLVVRKIPWRNSWKIKKLKIPFWLAKVCLLILLTAGWGYATYQLYRIPKFSNNVTGFYVARFENDRNDEFQSKIIDELNEAIRLGSLENVEVRRLPRIVQETEARQLGEEGRASLVLWGKVLSSQVKSYLTIVNARGVFQSPASVNGGTAFTGELTKLELPNELKTLQRVVAEFFVGYSYYNYSQYKSAHDFFETAAKDLGPTATKQDGITPEKATLGSILFYEGNTNWFLGNADQAIKNYESAIELTARPADKLPLYIEPLNNVALLKLQKGKLEEAINHLLQASARCEKEAGATCVFVSYNLGYAYIEKHSYQEALAALERAINLFHTTSASKVGQHPELRILGLAHQNIAYCYVKIADDSDGEQSAQYYKKADQEFAEATKILSVTDGVDGTSSLNLIRGRIYVGLKQYDAAIQLLRELKVSKASEANRNLLLAVAYKCKGDTSNSSEYAIGIQQLETYNDRVEAVAYFNKRTQTCQ